MNEQQRLAALEFFDGWMDKTSVGCMLVAMFQPEHMLGGLAGSVLCALVGLVLKIWSKK